MADIELTESSRLPSLTCTLYNFDGKIDLTNVTAVKWLMMDSRSNLKTDAPATIVAPAALGKVRYDWAALDVDTPGRYFGKWELTVAGKTQMIPSDRFLVVDIQESPRGV